MTSRAGRRRAALLSIPALALAATLVPAQTATAAAPPMTSNAVQRWNEVAGRVGLASCLSPGNDPLHESRMYALGALAAHDALNAVHRRYASYASRPPGGRLADPDAAVAAASRTALAAALGQLPPEFAGCRAAAMALVDEAYAAELAAVPDGAAEDAGVAVGTAAAAAVLATRVGDGSDTPIIVDASGYQQGTQPGQWRFTPDRPFAFAPGWGAVRTFALRGSQGRHVDPPYPLGSRAYARDLATVKRLGGDGLTTPSARTPDQTQVARFWVESSPLQWNRIARSVAIERHLDAWQSARLFSLLDMALADGYIVSFDVKFRNPFWRPVTAIREADTDGNVRTTADPAWTPLDTTPPIPDHDSAHAVQGGAAAAVLARVLGTDEVAFETCSLTLPEGQQCDDSTPVLRAYRSFSQAARENADSRVLVGFHFPHASRTGLAHGYQVGTIVADDLPAIR
ncbi:MAG: vanadium-dependent haloperoxidase [Ornithinibacter sp.]